MEGYQSVFKRKEIKYLLSYPQWKELLKRTEPFIQLDQYGKHLITNIYYDTDNWYLARQSMSKPVYKEKVRVRSYGVPKTDEDVFLELKKKYEGIVYKRRTSMPLKKTIRFLNHEKMEQLDQTDQILREFQYVLNLYSDLKPAMYISYERLAYFGKEDPSIRITFDQNILYRTYDLSLEKGSYGKEILPAKKLLMEVKIGGGMPVWLADIFADLKIYPAKFSKYSTGYMDHVSPKSGARIKTRENREETYEQVI